jgi:hypothetical protein
MNAQYQHVGTVGLVRNPQYPSASLGDAEERARDAQPARISYGPRGLGDGSLHPHYGLLTFQAV